ncbi:MAG: hypothetical protein IPI01_10340 [Ignavibacteriae bacterium]|nr:hypothetical protein [Ignavibacteriota bacterium]
MKRSSHRNVAALLMLMPASESSAQTTPERSSFRSSQRYTYQFTNAGASVTAKFYKLGSDTGTGWTRGDGAFGTLNKTSSPPCPLNDTAHIKTIWPSSRDLLIRRHLDPGRAGMS